MKEAKNSSKPFVNRRFKDTIFRRIFSEKKYLLELYNALNGSDYDDPDQLIINTLEDAIYINVKNDLSFIFNSYLTLYEHQSSVNPNIPLRDLDYVNRLIRGLTAEKSLYGSKAVKIPTPRFVVFYNGSDPLPDTFEYKLSDLYEVAEESPALELRVLVININIGHNQKLMETCRTLNDYAVFTQKVRDAIMNCVDEEEREEAVARVIDECIKEGILADFLRKHREEVIGMSLFEYDEEKHFKALREEGWEDGYAEGEKDGLRKGLEEGIEKGIEKGRFDELADLVRSGDLPIKRAAERAGISEEEFRAACKGLNILC